MEALSQIREEKICFREVANEIPSTTYGTFGLYRYPAKFIPQVISYVLKNYSEPSYKVLDPFAGSGTVGLVSRMYGLDYELWDLNPMLKVIHSASIMNPIKNVDLNKIFKDIESSKKKFLPKWSNLNYWFPKQVIPYLQKVWGFYYGLDNQNLKLLLTFPLLKVTRKLSYNDSQRQKLSSSPIAREKVNNFLKYNWENKASLLLIDEIKKATNKVQEYKNLLLLAGNRRGIQKTVKSGIDIIDISKKNYILDKNWDILITSPPYLQAQEYIRNSKLDLFWLGYSENEVKKLSQKELPYNREVEPVEIYSDTYNYYHEQIKEQHLLEVFERYFHGVLGALGNVSSKINHRMFLFVGSASIRSISVPIGRIFLEHFTKLGWQHEITLVDSIVSRVMFQSNLNPANGLKDKRITSEQLVILKRKN